MVKKLFLLLYTSRLFSDDEGQQLAVKLNASGPGKAHFIHCDVREEDQVKVWFCRTTPLKVSRGLLWHQGALLAQAWSVHCIFHQKIYIEE